MKKEQRTKEYTAFVEEYQSRLTLLTKDKEGQIILLTKSGEESKEDILEARLFDRNQGLHYQKFHMEDIYQSYKKGMKMDELICEAEQCLQYCAAVGRDFPSDVMGDYEAVRSRLILRAINYNKNAERLKGGVYELIGDIALALYVEIGEIGAIYSSCLVSLAKLKEWGISKDQVFEEAMKNTYRLYPPRLYNLNEVFCLADPDYGIFMDEEVLVDIKSEGSLFFVTTRFCLNGAVSVFLPGVAKRIGELFEADLYFAFISVNEAAVHACTGIKQITVQEGIERLKDRRDSDEIYLSDKVYYYSREKDEITVLE